LSKITLKQKSVRKGVKYRFVPGQDGQEGRLEKLKKDNRETNILIKVPHRIRVKTDKAYEERREKLLSTPGFMAPQYQKSKEEVFEEANGRLNHLTDKISRNWNSIMKNNKLPADVVEAAVSAKRLMDEAIDRDVNVQIK